MAATLSRNVHLHSVNNEFLRDGGHVLTDAETASLQVPSNCGQSPVRFWRVAGYPESGCARNASRTIDSGSSLLVRCHRIGMSFLKMAL